jgi:hypothetical protein
MLENRSFDCLLGKLYSKSDNFEGLNGDEQNSDAQGVAERGPALDHFSAPVSLIAACHARSKPRPESFAKRFLASARTWLLGRGRSGIHFVR